MGVRTLRDRSHTVRIVVPGAAVFAIPAGRGMVDVNAGLRQRHTYVARLSLPDDIRRYIYVARPSMWSFRRLCSMGQARPVHRIPAFWTHR